MISPEDREFARVVLESGAVAKRDVEACLSTLEDASREDDGFSLAALLVERGLLTRERSEALRREMERRPLPQPIPGYELLSLRGRGGMGAVYRARQLGTDRIVALKIIRSPEGKNPRRVERLRREASLLARLDHPNIVKGYDAGDASGYTYFAMEFVEGDSVKEVLRKRLFTEDEAVLVAIQIASALEHADSLGVVHRDVKPGNIMIAPDGFAKLTDLGLAKSAAEMTLTHSGATVGTPRYLSPEQARDPRRVDIRSDIYSLGATLYEMVSGEPPFRGDSIGAVVTKVLFAEPTPLHRLRPELSARFVRVLDRMMAKAPADRYQSAAELLIDLRRLQAGETPLAPRVRPRLRRRLASALAAAAGAAVFFSVVLFLALRGRGGDGPGKGGPDSGGKSAPGVTAEDVETAFARGRDAADKKASLAALRDLERISRELSGTPLGNAAAARAEDLERSLRADIESFVAGLERRARALVDEKGDRDGAMAFLGPLETGEAFRERYGVGPGDLPDAERAKANSCLAQARTAVEAAVAASASEAARELAAAALDRTKPVAERAALAAAASDRIEHDLLEYLGLEAGEKALALAAEARESVVIAVRNEVAPKLDAVRRAASENRFSAARERLRELDGENWQLHVPELVFEIDDVRASLLAREEALRRDLGAEWEAFLADRERRYAARDFEAVRDAAAFLVASLESAVREIPALEPVHRDAAAALAEADAILLLFRRAGEFIGREKAAFKLRGDPVEKTATRFESDAIWYTEKPSRDERRASVFDLPAASLRPNTGVPAQEAAKGVLLVDDAESTADLAARRGLLDGARKILDGVRSSGAEPAVVARLQAVFARAQDGLQGAQGEKLAEAENVLKSADAAYEAGDFAGASSFYAKLRDTAAFREVYRREKTRIDERIGLAAAAEEGADLSALFGGEAVVLDAAIRSVRVTFDFEREGASKAFDFGSPGRWSAEKGRLAFAGLDPAALSLRGHAGARLAAVQEKRVQFDLLRDFSLELTYTPDAAAPAGFVGVSLFGNNWGVLSRAQPPDKRRGQMNVWKGALDDHEGAFFYPVMDARPPAGLVDFAFAPGVPARLRLEIRDKGSRFLASVDGGKPIEFTLSEPRRDRTLEIRSWHAAAFDDLVIEGCLKK